MLWGNDYLIIVTLRNTQLSRLFKNFSKSMKSPPPPQKKLNFYYENLYFVVKIIISIIVFYSMHINFVQGKDYPSFRTCV